MVVFWLFQGLERIYRMAKISTSIFLGFCFKNGALFWTYDAVIRKGISPASKRLSVSWQKILMHFRLKSYFLMILSQFRHSLLSSSVIYCSLIEIPVHRLSLFVLKEKCKLAKWKQQITVIAKNWVQSGKILALKIRFRNRCRYQSSCRACWSILRDRTRISSVLMSLRHRRDTVIPAGIFLSAFVQSWGQFPFGSPNSIGILALTIRSWNSCRKS